MRGAEYYDELYRLGNLLDAGKIDLDKFYKLLETKFVFGNQNFGQFEYPHRLLANTSLLTSHSVWTNQLLPHAPRGMVRALVNAGLVPPKGSGKEREIIAAALGNTDPTYSVLEYLHNSGIITYDVRNTDLFVARMAPTVAFILGKGCNCADVIVPQFGHFSPGSKILACPYRAGPEKSKILMLLFQHGANFKLDERNYAFIDLATFKLLERHFPRNEIIAWIQMNRGQITIDRDYYAQMWPYLCIHYGFRFEKNEFIAALSYTDNQGPGDLPQDKLSKPMFVLDHSFLSMYGCKKHTISFVLSRLGTILSYNESRAPFEMQEFVDLDNYMIWNKYTIPYFSRFIKRQMQYLLLIFRRYYGSTCWIKPLIPKFIALMK